MSISNLILIQLVFLLVISWFFAVVAIRKLRKGHRDQARQIQELKRAKNQTVSEYKDSSIDLVKTEPCTDFDPGNDEDITDALVGLDGEFERNSQNVSELDSMLKSQADSISRLREMREALDSKKKNVDSDNLERELHALKEKNTRSEVMIAELSTSLARSRVRMQGVEKKMTRLKADAGLMPGLERDRKRLSMNSSRLEQQLKKDMFNHQQAIDRIETRLRVAENRSREGIDNAKSREKKLLNTIVELQGKLENGAGSNDETKIKALKDELINAQETLNRTVSEKEFLENNFLDLEKALQESESAKKELDRTKKEYEMLEQHFLALDEGEGIGSGDIDDVPEHRKNLDTLNPVEVASTAKYTPVSESEA